MRPLVLTSLFVALAVACGGSDNGSSPTASPTASPTEAASASASPGAADVVTFSTSGGRTIELEVEIADTAEERAQGLMGRESLAENAGMLFLYEEDHESAFWMKDTLVPLSIAFLLADGTIIDIQEMDPESLALHRPDERYRNAVEANQGWFEANGIGVGDVAELPTALSP